MTFNWLDFLFIAIISCALISGIRKGFVKNIFSLVGIVAALYSAIAFSSYFIPKGTSDSIYVKPVAFVVTAIIVYLIFKFAGFFFSELLKSIKLRPLDRFCGALFGIVKSVLVCWLIIIILSFISASTLNKSYLAPYFEKAFTMTIDFFSLNLKDLIKKKGDEDVKA